MSEQVRKGIVVAAVAAAVWLGVKYLLPVLLPFVLGLGIALAAEPAVGFGVKRLHLKRGLAAGVGVSLTLVLLAGVLWLAGALAVRELTQLAGALPDLEQTAQQGMLVLEDWMVGMAQRLPDGVRATATGTVLELFDGGTVLMKQVSERVPGLVGGVLSRVPDGALGLGTGLLSGFMLSARLPRLRQWAAFRLPPAWREKTLPALRRVGRAVLRWLRAQATLAAVIYAVLAIGLTVLRVRYGFLLALPIALVDAIPVFGTGLVLLPWAAVSLLQGEVFRGVGLALLYAAALLTRTVLEPRVVGRQLGLDPLVTLLFLYAGYRFWGIGGMLLAPMLASAASALRTEA